MHVVYIYTQEIILSSERLRHGLDRKRPPQVMFEHLFPVVLESLEVGSNWRKWGAGES